VSPWLTSVLIAIAAAVVGFIYLTIVILFFALFNPEPYVMLWRLVSGGRGMPAVGGGGRASSPAPLRSLRQEKPKKDVKRGKDRPVVAVVADSRRVFGEAYAEVVAGGSSADVDTADLENRPAPLLADVIGMVSRRDDAGLAARLAGEADPLAVLGIVGRVVDAKRVPQVRDALARAGAGERSAGLLRLQVGLHALGRFDDSIATADLIGDGGGSASAVLEARSAARLGDKKRTAAALERAVGLGANGLSEAALGDIARVGPDARVGAALARLRS
jgi:hypothetical protein